MLIATQKSAMADQLSLVESEKDEMLNQLEEESSRQDKVIVPLVYRIESPS